MDLKTIKQILDTDIPDIVKERLIINVLAEDSKVIPMILNILESEREVGKELLLDTNAELSRALVTIQDNKYGKKSAIIDRLWVVERIKSHYLKWKDKIKCNFKIEGLP